MSCGVGRRRSSDLALLWLWCRPAATAQIRPLAVGAALKRQQIKIKMKLQLQTSQDPPIPFPSFVFLRSTFHFQTQWLFDLYLLQALKQALERLLSISFTALSPVPGTVPDPQKAPTKKIPHFASWLNTWVPHVEEVWVGDEGKRVRPYILWCACYLSDTTISSRHNCKPWCHIRGPGAKQIFSKCLLNNVDVTVLESASAFIIASDPHPCGYY